jgi:hypothetical protein
MPAMSSSGLLKRRVASRRSAQARPAALCLLLAFSVTARPQDPNPAPPATPDEAEAVKRVVETYLYAEEPDEKKSPIHKEAKIYSPGPGGRMVVTPFSKPARRREGKSSRSPQRVVSVDVSNDCATVKVLTDFAPNDQKAGDAARHYQHVWLMKLDGEWKIVAVLMPSVRRPPAPRT